MPALPELAAGSRAASASRSVRTESSWSASSSVGSWTKAPCAGRRSTQPSVLSRWSASHTGWRATPRCPAGSLSTRCRPGPSARVVISSVSAS